MQRAVKRVVIIALAHVITVFHGDLQGQIAVLIGQLGHVLIHVRVRRMRYADVVGGRVVSAGRTRQIQSAQMTGVVDPLQFVDRKGRGIRPTFVVDPFDDTGADVVDASVLAILECVVIVAAA